MNLSIKSLLLLTMVIDMLFMLMIVYDPVLSQQQQQRKPKPTRKRKPPRRKGQKGANDNRLNCYTCYADFERIPLTVFNPVNYIYNNLCYNPSQNYTLADHEYLTKCSGTTKFCMVDITRMNDVLLSVDRRCGGATCRKTCLDRGYGVIRETCTFCCGGRTTEDDPEYDEEQHDMYKCPNEAH